MKTSFKRYVKQSAADPNAKYRLIVHNERPGWLEVTAVGFTSDGSEVRLEIPEGWPEKWGFTLAQSVSK